MHVFVQVNPSDVVKRPRSPDSQNATATDPFVTMSLNEPMVTLLGLISTYFWRGTRNDASSPLIVIGYVCGSGVGVGSGTTIVPPHDVGTLLLNSEPQPANVEDKVSGLNFVIGLFQSILPTKFVSVMDKDSQPLNICFVSLYDV